ncbi:MAG: hypothetical protein NWF14_03030, partial [Candidatus Bathyarchaeota archaeon]|nr:hypothetical protein [Candidatus Bathyarchaeota archaeon]
VKKRQVYIFFNNLSMFEDARRFLTYLEHKRLPPLTATKGLESVRLLIRKTMYPATKSTLIRKLGWRLVELEDGTQIRLAELLKNLPSKVYKNPYAVLKEIKL